jgi:hypothetical protein
MHGGGCESPDVVDAADEDVGSADGAADAVPSVCSVDPDVAGDADEDSGDAAAGGAFPPHAPTNAALAITGASNHASEQAHDDHDRIRLMDSG